MVTRSRVANYLINMCDTFHGDPHIIYFLTDPEVHEQQSQFGHIYAVAIVNSNLNESYFITGA